MRKTFLNNSTKVVTKLKPFTLLSHNHGTRIIGHSSLADLFL